MAFERVERIMRGGIGNEFTGAVARIEYRGIVVFEHAYGTTRLDAAARSVYCDTRFDLASLTKLFVATIALRLAQEGAIALDAPLSGVFAAWRGRPQEAITMRMLLAHNSGMDSGADYRAILNDNVERFALSAPLLASPGERVIYSDLGFIALGAALERIGQSSLPALMRRYFGASQVFRPHACQRAAIPATEEDAWRGSRARLRARRKSVSHGRRGRACRTLRDCGRRCGDDRRSICARRSRSPATQSKNKPSDPVLRRGLGGR